MVIGIIKQKGGVGASTLARLISTSYASAKWNVLLADMDIKQKTSTNWNERRKANNIEPSLKASQFQTVASVMKQIDNFDLIVFDGAPYSDEQSLEIAKNSDLIIIPTSTSVDDLEPTIYLCHELKENDINMNNVFICFSKIGNSNVELDEAFQYLKKSGYNYFNTVIYEKTAVRRALDEGRAPNETPFKSINYNIDKLMENIYKTFSDLAK